MGGLNIKNVSANRMGVVTTPGRGEGGDAAGWNWAVGLNTQLLCSIHGHDLPGTKQD
jgi:hypothetical protein